MAGRLLMSVAVLAGALAACLMSGAPCPCGETFDRDPFGSGIDFYVGADHDEAVHCFCRCGSDPRERLPPSETCEAYEGACRTRAGELARYVCD